MPYGVGLEPVGSHETDPFAGQDVTLRDLIDKAYTDYADALGTTVYFLTADDKRRLVGVVLARLEGVE